MSDLGEVTRKLVAVFAADVEGYSRPKGTDEVGTREGLTERRAILDKFIANHRGRIDGGRQESAAFARRTPGTDIGPDGSEASRALFLTRRSVEKC